MVRPSLHRLSLEFTRRDRRPAAIAMLNLRWRSLHPTATAGDGLTTLVIIAGVNLNFPALSAALARAVRVADLRADARPNLVARKHQRIGVFTVPVNGSA
jgi:hypothetical protein